VTALSIVAMPASAREPEPLPSAESPGCNGHVVSVRNHNSGEFGASENPKASAGPGFFLHQETSEAVQGAMEFCTWFTPRGAGAIRPPCAGQAVRWEVYLDLYEALKAVGLDVQAMTSASRSEIDVACHMFWTEGSLRATLAADNDRTRLSVIATPSAVVLDAFEQALGASG
jgi:hypothetical protein